MISGTMRNKKAFKRALMGAICALFWLGVWTVLYFAVDREVLIASPLKVFMRLFEMLGEKQLYIKVANSLLAILKGIYRHSQSVRFLLL